MWGRRAEGEVLFLVVLVGWRDARQFTDLATTRPNPDSIPSTQREIALHFLDIVAREETAEVSWVLFALRDNATSVPLRVDCVSVIERHCLSPDQST